MSEVAIAAEGIRLAGPLTLETLPGLESRCRELIDSHPRTRLSADVAAVSEIDTAGVVFLRGLPKAAEGSGKELVVGTLPEALQPFFDFVRPPEAAATQSPARPPLGRRFGDAAEGLVDRAADFLYLASDLTWVAAAALFRRFGIRRGAFVDQAVAVGSRGLPIVALILFLVGGVSTLQAAAQLRQFGANIFVADLLAIGITRELAPLMTAIIVAGRSGSAIAAEIATMKFTEEIDALRTMALDPLRMVAVPKMWAMLATVPLLTVMAVFFGLLGGTVTGVLSLDIAASTFVARIADALQLKDIFTGLVKSVSFAWIITVIGVHRGLNSTGGTTGVGVSTTSSVVSSIFGIIVLDLSWGLIFYMR